MRIISFFSHSSFFPFFFFFQVHGAAAQYHVLSVDIDTSFIHEKVRKDPNIEIVQASSVSTTAEEHLVTRINEARPGTVMITLDSAHSMKHVLAEMRMVTRHLSAGDYLVVVGEFLYSLF